MKHGLGRTIRFGYPAEPPTLDPLAPVGAAASARDILRPTMPALFALDDKLQPRPELAKSWPAPKDITLDPFTVKVTLRRAQWSDHKRITAADVRFSWQRLRTGPTGYRYRFLRDVEVLSAISFKLHFDRRLRRWWSLFSLDDMVLPAHAYSSAWSDGPTVSGGPFAFGGWTKGLQVHLVRNGNYWGRKARAAAIDVVFVPEDETRLKLVDRRELDAFSSIGDANMGRRAAAFGFVPTNGSLGGAAQASGAWASEWWELDVDPSRASDGVAAAVGQAVDSALPAEIFEDSGQAADGIPGRFPFLGARSDNRPAVPGPWAGRGSVDAARRALATGPPSSPGRVVASGGMAKIKMVFDRGVGGAALAGFIFFRLAPLRIRAELVGLDSADFEKLLVSGPAPAAVIRLRRGADAPDSSAYVFGKLGAAETAAADVARAESVVAASALRSGPVTGLDADSWGSAQRDFVASHSIYPLVRVREWIVGRGLSGPRALGTSAGPLWNAATWGFG